MRNLKGLLGCGPVWACGIVLCFSVPTRTIADEQEEEESSPVHITRQANGMVVLTLDVETQGRIALTTSTVEATTTQPTVVAYGKLEQDPARSFTLRSPAAGILRAVPGQSWPEIGSTLESNMVFGHVEPRLTASELVDLHAKRMDAQAEFNEIDADLSVGRASFENKSRLNSEHGLVSDRSTEEAWARYKSGEARLEAARQKVNLYDSLINGEAQYNALFPVRASLSGEIVEVLVQPGEVVDMGQVILRAAGFDSLIAAVSVWAGESVKPKPTSSQIVVVGNDEPPLAGEPLGPAPTASALTGGQTLLFRVEAPVGNHLRPGIAVTALIPVSGPGLSGVLIPRSAVLRHGGRTWAYVKTGEDRFERRDVVLHNPAPNGWFATSGVSPGENVVVEGAQFLLSEELKAQIENEEEAEG